MVSNPKHLCECEEQSRSVTEVGRKHAILFDLCEETRLETIIIGYTNAKGARGSTCVAKQLDWQVNVNIVGNAFLGTCWYIGICI